MPKKKKHTLIDKLSERFHILLVNEKTLEKKKLFSSSSVNLVGSTLFAFLLLLSTSFMLIYVTPLKEYFRGYTSIELRENAVENSMKLDSLESLYISQSKYIRSLKDLLSGNISFEELDQNSKNIDVNSLELEIVKTNRDVLFPPVKGVFSSGFDYESKHYGVDIAMPENSPVHSISEGIVVFAEWTSETGFVIILEHLNGLTSIYKHNSSIIKTQGDRIETGEIIAFTGNTGSLTTGPHLHFELWYQGEPVDPESYIEF